VAAGPKPIDFALPHDYRWKTGFESIGRKAM